MSDVVESSVPPGVELIKDGTTAWRNAQVVHLSPSWQGEPRARAVAEEIARHREYEPLLWDLLGDPNQLVAAYALVTLELMQSERLVDLPDALRTSRSNISLQFGSIRNGTDLGGFARQVEKRAKAAAEAFQPGPPSGR